MLDTVIHVGGPILVIACGLLLMNFGFDAMSTKRVTVQDEDSGKESELTGKDAEMKGVAYFIAGIVAILIGASSL